MAEEVTDRAEYTFKRTPELKADLEQNTRKFVEEMTRRLDRDISLRKDEVPKDLTASYGLLDAIRAFESTDVERGAIFDEKRGNIIPQEKINEIKEFYGVAGALHALMDSVRKLPEFDETRQVEETDRYQWMIGSGKIPRPTSPLRETDLSFWQAFKEGKFEDRQVIIGRHVAKQKVGEE